MTIFGIIWLTASFTCICLRDIKYLVFLLLLSAALQCDNVFNINGVGIGPQIITCILVIIKILYSYKVFFRRFDLVSCWILIFLAVICLSLFYNNIFLQSVLPFLQIFFYAICYILLKRISFDQNTLFRYIKYLTIFILVMGILQILITSGILPRSFIIKELFFNDDSNTVYFNYDNYYRLCSTFMEPSYCSCFLVGMFYYFASNYSSKDKLKQLLLLLVILIEILLTTSSTGYISLVVSGVFFLIFSNNQRFKPILIATGIIGVVGAFIFAYDILEEVIFDKSVSGSANARFAWDEQALNAFVNSCILGVGYENIRGSSLITSILGQLGIVGFLLYIVFNITILLPVFKRKKNYNNYYYGIRFAIIAVIICQAVACPDLDLCVYWQMLWISALLRPLRDEASRVCNTTHNRGLVLRSL